MQASRIIALFAAVAAADCGCGYSVNATNAPLHAWFTEKVESDFTASDATDITWYVECLVR